MREDPPVPKTVACGAGRAAPRRFYYKQNRLKQLRAFCHAVRAQSISKAADLMHLSQPSVSLRIRALEQEMGTVLFERRGPRISLTPEGRVLYELASPLVEGIDELPEAFAERCGNLDAGEIHVAAGESTILYPSAGCIAVRRRARAARRRPHERGRS